MAYGWTPEQMARVNERRSARGQKLLDPGKVNRSYASRYAEEEDRRKQMKTKQPFEEEPEMSSFDEYIADIRMRQALRGKKISPTTTMGRSV